MGQEMRGKQFAVDLRLQGLAAALANEGRLDEARQAAARVLASDPGYSLRHTVRLITPGPWRDHYLSGMRKAGIPD